MTIWSIRLLNAVLIVLAAALCAYWFWRFAAPPVVAPIETPPAEAVRPAETIRRANLFGAAAGANTTARLDLGLRGIYATRNGGMAVIALDRGRTVTVRSGDEIAPGIKLERVQRDHVVVSQGGIEQRLEMTQRKPLDAPPVKGPAPSQIPKP
jgi:type II secretory pathway component PulC